MKEFTLTKDPITVDDTYFMEVVHPDDSGMATWAYIWSKDQIKGIPRIKVANTKKKYETDNIFSVSISKTPKVLFGTCLLSSQDYAKVVKWVKLNYEALIDHWNNKYYDKQMYVLDDLKSVSPTLSEEFLVEMSNFLPKDTGLKAHIFISTKAYVKGAHGPRIKVSNIPGKYDGDNSFSIIISKTNPKIARDNHSEYSKSENKAFFDWIKLNYEVLMDYWNEKYPAGKPGIDMLKQKLKKLKTSP